ncbi:MAG: RHS repeat protein [Deltaproteobacteria bacterium]|nr:RHS repeat protein [Deltaproteobacteria bacterium]MBI3293314.1 RHS repeat protein [Deltaproteobacteria bacterium]
MKTALILFIASTSLLALNVNRLNGSMNLLYVDFSIPGPVLPVELARSYNSITAVFETNGWNGAFGWGWTSLMESVITLTGDRKILLRDGFSGNTLTFASAKESPAVKARFMHDLKRAFFQDRLGRKLSDAEVNKLSLPPSMEVRLANEPKYRADAAAQFHITSPLPRGEVLISSEFGLQTMEYRNNYWIRKYDGLSQAYDKNGRIARQTDKNGFTLLFTYSTQEKSQIVQLQSEDRSVSIRFTWRKNRIIEAVDNRNLRTAYTYDQQGNLTKVTDSTNQAFSYRYESPRHPHLITGIDYLTESTDAKKVTREMKYDENGLITFSREKDGAETQYSYGRSATDPRDHFWTKYVTQFADGKTDEQIDDYTIRTEPSGTRYLYRLETKKNGKSTVTIYGLSGGKPLQIVAGGVTTDYKYFPNGMLMEKTSPSESLKFEYDPRFNKITRLSQNGIISTFRYDKRGNVIQASNSKNESVALNYDRFGRITEMTSPNGSRLSFRYGNQGKPILIDEKGVGTIRIAYDPTGRIVSTQTLLPKIAGHASAQKTPQEIIRAVMSGFQNLLNIIRPAGVPLPMG